MKSNDSNCVLLADRHHGLRDSVRGLLESAFETVFMVADEASLLEGAGRLNPPVIVLELELAGGDFRGLLKRINGRSPDSRILVLTVHDERTVIESVLAAGACAVVLKRNLIIDLLPAVDALRTGNRAEDPQWGE
jgi:DNA-binding NarL/FixJ family response regulator